jgi:hypothetical protein
MPVYSSLAVSAAGGIVQFHRLVCATSSRGPFSKHPCSQAMPSRCVGPSLWHSTIARLTTPARIGYRERQRLSRHEQNGCRRSSPSPPQRLVAQASSTGREEQDSNEDIGAGRPRALDIAFSPRASGCRTTRRASRRLVNPRGRPHVAVSETARTARRSAASVALCCVPCTPKAPEQTDYWRQLIGRRDVRRAVARRGYVVARCGGASGVATIVANSSSGTRCRPISSNSPSGAARSLES